MSALSPTELLLPLAKGYAKDLARAAHERGLAVTQPDGSTVPIPITATPLVLAAAEIARRAKVSALLASAGLKMATRVLDGPLSEMLLGCLGPLERRVVEGSYRSLTRLAITRVDFFVADRPYALELNATIPAMPAYSDLAANTFIEVLGRTLGLKDPFIAGLQARNGSNTLALYRALLWSFQAEKGHPPERIAILVRRADAQLTEVRYLAARFNDWGTPTDIVYPDEASGDATGFRAQGKRYDLVYRHLFVRRLEKDVQAPFLEEFLAHPAERGAVVFNGPAAHVETKTTFALLSQAQRDVTLAQTAGLSEEEVQAIAEHVPWTRPLRPNPSVDPDGEPVTDLVERVAAEPDRFVLKRAWDYGGKAVFIGNAREEKSFVERVKGAYGGKLAWPALVKRASEDPVGGGFVVQELVRTRTERHWIAHEKKKLEAVDMYVDYSAYASVGLDAQPAWGGVCRGSPSKIVNILGGGGVLPLLTEEVFASLANALRARG